MAFDADIQHWPTISAFTAYLEGVPRPPWCRLLCNHNTYKPDETTWRGMASMRSLLAFYRDTQQWPSGPHLFLAASAPNPADTGIFQLTPITHPGTHAGPCNADALGLENVGNFDRAPPSADQYTLLLAVNRALLERWGMPPAFVNVHNECMAGRTCPGKYLTGTQIRASLNSAWPRPDPFAGWGPIGHPAGMAATFAVPRAWLVNKSIGACVAPETYSASGAYSVTEFERGLIIYMKARNTTVVEVF